MLSYIVYINSMHLEWNRGHNYGSYLATQLAWFLPWLLVYVGMSDTAVSTIIRLYSSYIGTQSFMHVGVVGSQCTVCTTKLNACAMADFSARLLKQQFDFVSSHNYKLQLTRYGTCFQSINNASSACFLILWQMVQMHVCRICFRTKFLASTEEYCMGLEHAVHGATINFVHLPIANCLRSDMAAK